MVAATITISKFIAAPLQTDVNHLVLFNSEPMERTPTRGLLLITGSGGG